MQQTIKGIGEYIGTIEKTFVIKRISISKKKATLSKTSYVYESGGLYPSVSIKGLNEDIDFEVAYYNNWDVGKARIEVYGIGSCYGTINKTFTIKPAKSKISSVTTSNKTMKVKIKSQKKSGVTGYQIYYKKAGGSAKKVTTTSTTKTIKGLITGKKYTVKVRAYKTINGKKVYGQYSKAKTVTIKRAEPEWCFDLDGYSTRYKTITITIYNEGTKTLTFYSSGAKYIDKDYVECDRNLKIVDHDSVSIKPGHKKTIKLKVTSGRVWWSPEGSKVMIKGKYDGKKYNFYCKFHF